MDAVVRPELGNRRGAGLWAFLLALVTVAALAHVAVRMQSIQIAYDLGRERRTNTELEERRRRLNIEIGMLKAPDRIIGIARDKLHMGPPPPEAVLHLPRNPGTGSEPPAMRSVEQSSTSRDAKPAREGRK